MILGERTFDGLFDEGLDQYRRPDPLWWLKTRTFPDPSPQCDCRRGDGLRPFAFTPVVPLVQCARGAGCGRDGRVDPQRAAQCLRLLRSQAAIRPTKFTADWRDHAGKRSRGLAGSHKIDPSVDQAVVADQWPGLLIKQDLLAVGCGLFRFLALRTQGLCSQRGADPQFDWNTASTVNFSAANDALHRAFRGLKFFSTTRLCVI